jgi:hypothetical protein
MDPKNGMLISRAELMRRWRISIESVKRQEKEGVLAPGANRLACSPVPLADVVRAEEQATDLF